MHFCVSLKVCVHSLFQFVIFIKEYSFFLTQKFVALGILLSNNFHTRKRINKIQYYIFRHCSSINGIVKKKVRAFGNLNIFHINYVNIMINNQLHSLFKTCNVAFS